MERGIFMPVSTTEKILSEDYFDLIVPITGSDTDFEEAFFRFGAQAAVPGYGIIHINRQFLPDNILNVIGYSNIPKLYTLMDTSALESSGILKVQTQPLLGYQGEGVLIGFLDTGIDFTHPAFRTSDGRSRIYRLWDQTIQSGTAPDGFFYGSEYTNENLNAALNLEDPLETVPSVDENGHGSFLASVAAGTALPLQDFSGAAPKSEIVAVKLKPAKENLRDFFLIRESAVAYQETDIMLALRYLLQCARQAQKPLVICFGLGTNQGDHSGYMPLAEALDTISRMNTVYVVSAAGNEAGRGHHFYGKMENTSDYQNVEVLVPENEGGFTMELWASEAAAFRNENGMDQKQTRKRIEEIKAAIRQMGNINVNAIEDYKEMSQRHGFLQNQHDDLIKAEKALEEIILELDEGMRKQFRENFARIQVEFDKAFRELFGGGKGTLELVDDEDILEAGIRIISQPPGKKLQNMMQLSGGEKALTAIALLFAIQHLKPSPFCLLDEIEAALDEANVSRYANYLHKLTKNTQFIIITHRRGTMAAADRLYGITMQEKGISALVSVNLIEEALDQ